MPKIVSRSAVSTSTEAAPTESSTAALRVYYCICGEFILVIDKGLNQLPRRETDGAIILRCRDGTGRKARIFKLNATEAPAIFVQRAKGHERQFRFLCPRCTLPVGYQSTPPPAKSGEYLYINYGALTQIQGKLPAEAFEGEEEVADVNMSS